MGINSYAQNFEDVMLWRALGHIQNGFYIDVGANDPIVDSVSRAFYEHGWRGIHIEATPQYAQLLRENRPDETVLQVALSDQHGMITFYEIPETGISTGDKSIAQEHIQRGFPVQEIIVPCMTLSDVFDQIGSRDIHWLKIDVEGFEDKVLRGWENHQTRPWILVIESTLPLTTIETYQQWEEILLERDYEPVYFDGLNRYYISSEHLELKVFFNSPPNVFDGFTLNGTASASMHQLIKNRYEDQLHKFETLNHELELLRSDTQNKNEKLIKQQTELSAEHLVASVQRENEFARKELSLNSLITQIQKNTYNDAKNYLTVLAQREKEFASELSKLRENADVQLRTIESENKEAITALLAERTLREQNLLSQVESIRTELSTQTNLSAEHLATLAQREKEFASELKQIVDEKHTVELQSSDLSHLLTAAQLLESQLHNELSMRQQMLADLSLELAQIRGSLSWRITAPLRAIGILFTSSHSDSKVVSMTMEDLEDASVQMKESVAVIDSFSNMTVEEPVIPKPEQPIISTKEIFMPSSPTVAATSLDELLAYHDVDFIHCAYITLLGRVPDPDGMRYYLGRLRAGRSKIVLVAQLSSSVEAKNYNANVTGLNQAIGRYRWKKMPIIGTILKSMFHQDEISRQMRQIENSLYLLGKDMNHRFDTVEQQIKQISYTVVTQLDAEILGADTQTTENTPNLSHMSPSARKIYTMLKNAQGSK